MEYVDFGRVSCIDRQIAELQARKDALMHGYCFIGYAPQPAVEYVEVLNDAKIVEENKDD